MKLRKITLLGVLSLFVFNQEAKSVEFSDKVYGKAYFNVGYAMDLFKSKKIEKFIDENKNFAELNSTHFLSFGLGYNVFFKATENIHPFIGLGLEYRLPLSNKVYKEKTSNVGIPWELKKPLDAYFKFGVRFNITKHFALQPYGFIGLSWTQLYAEESYTETDRNLITGEVQRKVFKFKKNVNNFGLLLGVGLDAIFVINNYFGILVGIDYRCTIMKNVTSPQKTLMNGINGKIPDYLLEFLGIEDYYLYNRDEGTVNMDSLKDMLNAKHQIYLHEFNFKIGFEFW